MDLLLVLEFSIPASRVARAGFHWGLSPGLADSCLLVPRLTFSAHLYPCCPPSFQSAYWIGALPFNSFKFYNSKVSIYHWNQASPWNFGEKQFSS
jgi:hypothetical protein